EFVYLNLWDIRYDYHRLESGIIGIYLVVKGRSHYWKSNAYVPVAETENDIRTASFFHFKIPAGYHFPENQTPFRLEGPPEKTYIFPLGTLFDFISVYPQITLCWRLDPLSSQHSHSN